MKPASGNSMEVEENAKEAQVHSDHKFDSVPPFTSNHIVTIK